MCVAFIPIAHVFCSGVDIASSNLPETHAQTLAACIELARVLIAPVDKIIHRLEGCTLSSIEINTVCRRRTSRSA